MATREELDNHFKSKNIHIVRFPDQDTVNFSTLEQFYEFMTKERDFWAECKEGTTSQIYSHFRSIVASLDAASNEGNIQQWTHHLNDAISRAEMRSFPCVYSSTPTAKLIKERYIQNRHHADAICQYIFQNNMNNMGNKNFFEGYLYAFLTTQFDGGIDQKVKAEEQALAELRGRYTEELNTLHREYLTRGDECSRMSGEMDGKYNVFCKEMTDWKAGIQQSADTLLQEKQEELEELKKLHREQLRLKEPAQYWADLETEYMTKGEKWKNRLIWSAVLFVAFLTSVLFRLPETMFPNGGDGSVYCRF